MSIHEKMTAIADPIRSLTGIRDKLGLDAMASVLGNANTSLSAALTALQGKGVDVPYDANLGELPSLIESVNSGGVETCSVTVDFYAYGAIMYTQGTPYGIYAQQLSAGGQTDLTSVVCGSMLALYLPSSSTMVECYNTELIADYGNFKAFSAPTSPGNGSIIIRAS